MPRLTCTLLFALVASLFASPARAADQPNIIIILSDDMGFSDIGCYGCEISTPALDKLAANGVRFTQFYNTGRCCPTRAALLTGLYPHQAGIGHMMEDRGHEGYSGNLNKQCVTIAEALKPAGYRTYMAGKWHVTRHIQPEGPKFNWPRNRGFDRFYGTITGAGSFFDPGTLTRDDTMISPFADPEYPSEGYYYTDAISDHAVRYINDHAKDHSAKPFFLYVAYTAAHWPMHAKEEDIAKYKGKYDAGFEPIRAARFERVKKMGLVDPKWQLSPRHSNWEDVKHKEWDARNMEVYAAMVDSMDQGIGRIVDSLKKTKQLDNTLILYMQDNGGCQEGVGRGGNMTRPDKPTLPPIAHDAIRMDVIPRQNRAGVPTLTGPNVMPGPEDTYIAYGIGWANVSNTPFREYKHYVHEGGIGTPLIAHWPAKIKRKGELEKQPGHLVDLMATCIDIAGATYPKKVGDENIKPMEGVSLLPAFLGKPLDRKPPIFWEHEGNRAIRDGKWKLVAKENRPWELYDMEADRTEMKDLAKQMPEKVKELEAKWDAYAERANVLPLGMWRGRRAATEQFNNAKSFALEPGDDLDREKAPYIINKAIHITAELDKPGEGVILAQGGSSQGYALYVKDGKAQFAVRQGGQITLVAADEKLPADKCTIEVKLAAQGKVRLLVDGKQVATGKASLFDQMPLDGLQVGQDAKGLVGDYSDTSPFKGVIRSVQVSLSGR